MEEQIMKFSKWTRALTIMLALILFASFAACSGKASPSDGSGSVTTAAASTQAGSGTEAATAPAPEPLGKYSPEINVTSVKSLDDTMQKLIGTKSDVVTNNIWFNAYKNDLGINVSYNWTVPGAQFEQKMNVAISANDLPDIIPANQRQLKLLVDSGVALDLTKIFQDYASPFTMEMMQADNNVSIEQATFDGKLMAIPQVSGNRDHSNMLWIRNDWLKNLNLQAPRTMDDVFKIAEAFTKDDPDQNGKDDTYGLALQKGLIEQGWADISGFMESYHAYIGTNAWIKDSSGKLVYGGIQPEVKTALTKLAEMYKAGQIDKEFSIKDGSKVAESVVGGRVGMIYGQHFLAFYPFQDCKNKDPKSDWMPYPLVSIDEKPVMTMVNGSAGLFYVVNKEMKNPEAAVKLYNYYYAKDPALSGDFDPKFHGTGIGQGSEPGENYFWAVVQTWYPMQNLFIHQQVKKYFETKDEALLQNYWIKDNVEQNKKYLAGDNKFYSAFAWSGTNGAESIIDYYDQNGLMLQNAYIKADTDSMTQKGATLKQTRDEIFTKIIMGIAPVSDFDKYVEQWHKLGGDDITDEVNAVK